MGSSRTQALGRQAWKRSAEVLERVPFPPIQLLVLTHK